MSPGGQRRRGLREVSEKTVEEQVLYEEDEAVAVVTLDREEKLNAMNTQIVRRLTELFDRIDQAHHIRAAVLTGKGGFRRRCGHWGV